MRWSRRTFLGSLGASLLGGLAAPRRARAQAAGARRLIVFFTPDGTVPEAYWPRGIGASFSFAPGSVLEPLAGLESQLTIVGGLEYVGGVAHDRGMIYMLTNSGWENVPEVSETAGRSLDQYVADRVHGTERFSSLELGVQTSVLGAMMESRMCYRGPQRWVSPNDDPRDVHRRLFGEVTPDAVALAEDRRSVLDLVREETTALAGRLPPAEKAKLDMHLDALRDVERNIEPPEPGARCGAADAPPAFDVYDNDRFGEIGRAQMDLLVAAMSCDLTRVGSIQWSHAASETLFSWLGHAESHHSLSHMDEGSPEGVAQFIEDGRWYTEQFRYLVERLAALPEPGGAGSMLDHSVVLWTTEIGDGVTHMCEDVPVVIAGGGSGRLRPGRYLRYDGESHGKLLTSLCWAMGLDNQSFGNPATGGGGLGGLVI